MDTYSLITLVALFLGVLVIIIMLEMRRRTELARTEQLQQSFNACVSCLQAIHSNDQAQMGKIVEALSQLRTAIETETKSSAESVKSLSIQTLRAVEQAAARLETTVQQHQKALDITMIRAADKLSVSSVERSKELLSETQRMTKAVQDLQASLEASAKF